MQDKKPKFKKVMNGLHSCPLLIECLYTVIKANHLKKKKKKVTMAASKLIKCTCF